MEGNKTRIIEEIRQRKYKPKPVLLVEIPKPIGGTRVLGIPTVTDRVIQPAIAQILTSIYDQQFSEYSYGFSRIGSIVKRVGKTQAEADEAMVQELEDATELPEGKKDGFSLYRG